MQQCTIQKARSTRLQRQRHRHMQKAQVHQVAQTRTPVILLYNITKRHTPLKVKASTRSPSLQQISSIGYVPSVLFLDVIQMLPINSRNPCLQYSFLLLHPNSFLMQDKLQHSARFSRFLCSHGSHENRLSQQVKSKHA